MVVEVQKLKRVSLRVSPKDEKLFHCEPAEFPSDGRPSWVQRIP